MNIRNPSLEVNILIEFSFLRECTCVYVWIKHKLIFVSGKIKFTGIIFEMIVYEEWLIFSGNVLLEEFIKLPYCLSTRTQCIYCS